MSEVGAEGIQRKRGGKRAKQLFTESEARRLLRAAKAEDHKCILRKRPDGSLELVPMTDAERDGGKQNEWDSVK